MDVKLFITALAALLLTGCFSEQPKVASADYSLQKKGDVVILSLNDDKYDTYAIYPKTIDTWILKQKERPVVRMVAYTSASSPGAICVFNENPEYHVANHWFFARGYGFSSEDSKKRCELLEQYFGMTPFIYVNSYNIHDRTISIPANRDYDVFLFADKRISEFKAMNFFAMEICHLEIDNEK